MVTTRFHEEQRFTQVWMIFIELALLVLTAFIAIYILITKKADSFFAAIPLLVAMAVVLLFRLMSLQVTISREKISYRFRPFHIKWNEIPRESISRLSVVQYDPIREYGGWGIRYGKHGKAYTVKGRSGISIDLLNGKHLMIGTSIPKEAQRSLADLGYLG